MASTPPINQAMGAVRVPPQNIDAEVSVLGALLLDQNAVVKVADITMAEDFYDRRHQLIYEAILVLFEKRQPVDALTVKSKLEDAKNLDNAGGATYIASLVNAVSTATHVVHHAEIVREKAVLRRLISAANEISQLGYKEDEEIDVVLDRAEQSLFAVSQKFLKQNFITIRSVLSSTFERINDLTENKGQVRGVPTGFRALDNMLAGFQKSDLLILAARPSMGKTSLALNFVEHIAVEHKKNVGVFSLEMSADQLTDRMLCVLGNIDAWRLRTGNLSDADFGRLHEAMGKLAEAGIFIDDSPFVNVMEMRARARRLQMEHGLDFLVVDYLQLMGGGSMGGNSDNRVQEVSYISRSLKALARELNIPVLALSQLSRAVEQRSPKIPQLSDLRESGCLTGETLIVRADTGMRVQIKDLVGQKDIPVWSLNEKWKIQKSIISSVFSSGKKAVFELKMRSGKSIRASANHPFRTITGWQRLDQLVVGQRLATPRAYQLCSNDNPDYSTDLLIFLAHMIGDGCYVDHQPVHYTSADEENIATVAAAVKGLFGIVGRVEQQENWYHLYLPMKTPAGRGLYHPWRTWLESQGLALARSYEKKLPETLFTCSNKQLQLFVSHLWSTDGCLSVGGDKVSVYYATTSQTLAEQLQSVLLRLGIWSTIHQVAQRKGDTNYRPSHHVVIQGKENQEKFLREVGVFGRRGHKINQALELLSTQKSNPNLDTLEPLVWSSVINPARQQANVTWRQLSTAMNTAYSGSSLMKRGLSRQRLGRVATALQNPALNALSQSDVYWDEILSITPQGVEEVYDATVPDTHNFVANDIIVHNSIEQDADVVMFIYREDFYNPDTERKHIAEIHIAKHRNGPTGKAELYFRSDQTKFMDLDTSHVEGVVNVYEQPGGAMPNQPQPGANIANPVPPAF